MKIKFYLDSKATKSGEVAIWCYVREFDKTLTINTGQRIEPNLWDSTFHRANLRKTKDKIVKGRLNNINQYLNTIENKISDISRSIRSKNFAAGFSEIVDAIKKQFDTRETSIFAVYDEFLSIK